MKVKETARTYLSQRKNYSYQDYLDMPDDGQRYEIYNGELVMVPAPSIKHQEISGNIEHEIRSFVRENKSGKVLYAPVDMVLDERVVLQPDIVFIAKDNLDIITEEHIGPAPDLIIEILSPSTGYYDLVEKKELYEQYGVKEYWIVDPKKKRVETFNLREGKYVRTQRLEGDASLTSEVLAGFEMPLAQVFAS